MRRRATLHPQTHTASSKPRSGDGQVWEPGRYSFLRHLMMRASRFAASNGRSLLSAVDNGRGRRWLNQLTKFQ